MNVDLVLSLPRTFLITSISATSPGPGFTNPVRDILAFASIDPPDLTGSRRSHDSNSPPPGPPHPLAHSLHETSQASPPSSPLKVIQSLDHLEDAPVAGFVFPQTGQSHTLTAHTRPLLARFVHIKLLSAFLHSSAPFPRTNIGTLPCC